MLDLARLLSRLTGADTPTLPTSREVRAAMVQAVELRAMPLERQKLLLSNSPKLQTIALVDPMPDFLPT